MQTPRTLIVGGYGLVGSLAARELARKGHQTTLAGRAPERGAQLAGELGCKVVRLDVEHSNDWDAALDHADRVLVCIDQTDTSFARRVLERGLDYVDVTASDRFFRAVEQLDPVATRAGASAVLSVGLAPGLTNLLVQDSTKRLEHPTHARIALRLGLRDAHGRAAIGWMLEQLAAAGGRPRLERVQYSAHEPPTLAGPVDFADQHVVLRTLGLRSARTLLTLESTLWTRLLFHSRALFRSPTLRRWLSALLVKLPLRWGSDSCAVKVEVSGLYGGEATTLCAGFVGRGEAHVTARLAAAVVDALPRVRRAGVHHIEQLFSLSDVRNAIDVNGDTTWDLDGGAA